MTRKRRKHVFWRGKCAGLLLLLLVLERHCHDSLPLPGLFPEFIDLSLLTELWTSYHHHLWPPPSSFPCLSVCLSVTYCLGHSLQQLTFTPSKSTATTSAPVSLTRSPLWAATFYSPSLPSSSLNCTLPSLQRSGQVSGTREEREGERVALTWPSTLALALALWRGVAGRKWSQVFTWIRRKEADSRQGICLTFLKSSSPLDKFVCSSRQLWQFGKMSFGGSSMYLTLYVAVKTDCHILEDTIQRFVATNTCDQTHLIIISLFISISPRKSSSSKSSSSSAAVSNSSKFLEKPRRFVDRHFGNSSKNKCSLRWFW